MPRPPFFPQTFPFSCVPACIKMILASFGFEKSEAEIRSFCECDETGTSPSKAVEAVIKFGFNAYQANLIFEELEDLISQKITPIVFTKFAEDIIHAIIVYKISKEKIYALDPQLGESKFDIDTFTENWLRGLTLVIEKR